MATTDVRVIVCGSRDYPHPELVSEIIGLMMRGCHQHDRRLVIVHGACPSGADYATRQAVAKLKREGFSVDEEAHPADFEGQGLKAGPIRNTAMAKAGAVLCIEFWNGSVVSASGGTPGTIDMQQKAKRAGIPFIGPTKPGLDVLRPLFENIWAAAP